METTAAIRTSKLLRENGLTITAMEIVTNIINELPIKTKTLIKVSATKPVGLGMKNENTIPRTIDRIIGLVKKLLKNDFVKICPFLPK